MHPQDTILCACGCGTAINPIGSRGRPRQYARSHSPLCGPLSVRFWKHVQKTDGCWLWTGHLSTDGYGTIRNSGRGKTLKAHRASWELAHGPIPTGLHVLHQCDNPGCVRPDHLFLGTHADNMANMAAKGRSRVPVGILHYRAKLTDADVLTIRARYAEGGITKAYLASEYSVTPPTISAIIHRHSWKHI